jgi:ParB family transcriptional regulator, chromosome partitioning protein
LKGEPIYDPADIAPGGAFVSLGFDGSLRVERGFIRKADEAPVATVRGEAKEEARAQSFEASTALPERWRMSASATAPKRR